ncbi:MAG TPA: hypothetical protein VNI84_20660 [Pyrinomonadaceae bacterium]|nr:hypothetical protein [Pyrinomonadaceae bacterium]
MSHKKKLPSNQTKNVRRPRQQKGASLSLRYRFLMLLCGMCLIIGFFFAARQHFSSIDLSIKNSRLRKMSEELESDKRRLLLAKEIALSPTEIKKAAQKIGYKVASATNIDAFRPNNAKPAKTPAEKPGAPKPKSAAPGKTAASAAAAEKASAKKIKENKTSAADVKKGAPQTAK